MIVTENTFSRFLKNPHNQISISSQRCILYIHKYCLENYQPVGFNINDLDFNSLIDAFIDIADDDSFKKACEIIF